eukprot:TRINITY_DN47724_c0_g1_i1.p1 TRINITY_DN47724_c0_g1~~TRINITY_DN47724_c0_g1_i1.p1  ORF type:complete len:141 (-),score=19.03 TRINITY_DN47724_c0_g1_i1:23-388(-)
MSRYEALHSSQPPSRPLSRTSRAASIGSLVDYFPYGGEHGCNLVTSHCMSQDTKNEEKGSQPFYGRKQLGGRGLLMQGRSHLSSCPTRESNSPSHTPVNRSDNQGNGPRKYNFMHLPLNSR